MRIFSFSLGKKKIKISNVYKYEGRMIVSAYDAIKNGPWREQAAFLIEDQDDPVAIGFAVHRAFAIARTNVPQPGYETLNRKTYPSLQMSGAKSHSAFMKTAQSVSIQQEGLITTVAPEKNEGERGGFTQIDQKAIALHSPDDRALGEAILAAFAQTE